MTAKEYLNQARHLDALINCRLREIDYWRDLSSSVSGSNFEPHYNPNKPTEAPFARCLEKIDAIQKDVAFSLHTSCRTGRYLRSKMRWNHMDIRQTFCFALITGTPKLLKPCMDSIAVRSSFFSLPAQQRARLCSYFLHCL